MKCKGCKPKGITLFEHLDGSLQAKERLKVILATAVSVTDRMTIGQACQRLGIKKARFHRLRMEVLEASLACTEPRPAGRPSRQATPDAIRCKALERQVAELQAELKIAAIREEIAQVMPNRFRADSSLKKRPRFRTGSSNARRRDGPDTAARTGHG
jgi:hypothetical protein